MRGRGRPAALRRVGASVIALAVALHCGPAAEAEAPRPPERPTHNLFGMTGLIDMPTAELQPDGQISLSTSYFGGFSRNTLSAQIFPGIEAAFRYSVLQDFFDRARNEATLYDRSFDIKLRLLEETGLRPAVAVGLRDFLGTGVYSSEYVVGTKSFLDGDLSVTGGIGWGRLSGLNGINNPLCLGYDRFCERESADAPGGTVNFGEYFSGEELGVFGGVEWRTPIEGLTVKAEYSPDTYDREKQFSDFEQEIPLNFGVQYRPLPWAEFGLHAMYGSGVGLSLTISGNAFDPPVDAENEPGPRPLPARPVPADIDRRAGLGEVREMLGAGAPAERFAETPLEDVTIERRLGDVRWGEAVLAADAPRACPATAATAVDAAFGDVDALTVRDREGRAVCTLALRPEGTHAIRLTRRAATGYPTDWHADEQVRATAIEALTGELAADGLSLYAVELMPERVSVFIENPKFAETPRAVGRTARALARHMPASVGLFEIVPMRSNLPVVAITLERADLEDQVNRPDAARKSWLTAEVDDAEPREQDRFALPGGRFPRFSWRIDPQTPVSLFDPDEPVRADLAVTAAARVELTPEFSLNASASKRIVGNLDNITRESDSQLPRVRSDFAEYLREGDPGITRLTADYVTKLTPTIYGRVSGGLLESMFAGISGELLWKPVGRSWGVGAEVNYSRQRDFDMLFGLRDYDVVTGHASLYWETGIYGVTTQIDAGRYLAGDWGGTIGLSRRFPNGWEIGAFATFTDVSFNEFGEGSFDKGITLTIPLNWTLPYESRSTYSAVIRPLTRDGGQRLNIANRLYPTVVRDHGRNRLRQDWGSFWE